MENDYRITKLHGTLIGDNRIPDLPNSETAKILSSTNGKTSWADLPTDVGKDANGFAVLRHDGVEITGQKKTVKLADVRENGAIIGRDDQFTSAPQTNELITNAYADKSYGRLDEANTWTRANTFDFETTFNDEVLTKSGISNLDRTDFVFTGEDISQLGFNFKRVTGFVSAYSIGPIDDPQSIPAFEGVIVASTEASLNSAPVLTHFSATGKFRWFSYIESAQYDYQLPRKSGTIALTSDIPGGGGASVSPTLNLLTEDLSAVRSSITEEEKVNLEKGLYNSVLFIDFSLGDGAIAGVMFPQRLVGLGGDFMFSSYKAKPGTSEADDWSFSGASTYGLSIGEKTTDGNYPITINKMNDVKGIQTINAVLTVDQATQDITIQLDVTPSGDMFILSPTQSEESGIGNVLMVRQPDGNYSGFWSISDDTVVCYVKPDGTGFAFYSPTAFLFQTMQETDGKVLTIESGVPRWLDPVSSLPVITSADVGKFLTVKSDQKTAWGSVPQGSPIEIVLDESKPYFNLGEYNKKIGVYLLSRPNNAILYEAKFDNDSATFTKILLYGSMKASAQNVDYLDVSGSLYGLNGDNTLAYIGSGIWQLKSEDNYKFLPYPYSQEASLCCSGGISGAIPSFTLYGSAIGKTSPDYIGLLPQVCKYCALRYDFKKTSSSTDTEKVTSAFFGSVSADNILTPTKITLIGIFDNGMGKAVLEKNASGVFESKTPIEYVEDVNAITYSKARYKHTVTLKTSAGAILWTQTLSNSKNTPVNTYEGLKTLFGGELLAGFGEYCQLDLRGGTEATDKLIKADGTEATLESLGAIVYTDVCFLPK